MTTTQTFKAAFYNQQTDEVPLVIIKIEHDDLSDPICLVNNTDPIYHNDEQYIAFPFNVVLPKLDGESPPSASIEIDNVDRRIVQAVRSISTKPDLTLSVILASRPDVVEQGPYYFKLSNTSYDFFKVVGNFAYDDFFNEPYPGDNFTPGQWFGLFA